LFECTGGGPKPNEAVGKSVARPMLESCGVRGGAPKCEEEESGKCPPPTWPPEVEGGAYAAARPEMDCACPTTPICELLPLLWVD